MHMHLPQTGLHIVCRIENFITQSLRLVLLINNLGEKVFSAIQFEYLIWQAKFLNYKQNNIL